MKQNVLLWSMFAISSNAFCQNLGIGIITPRAGLHVVNGSVIFSANEEARLVSQLPEPNVAGRRMLWYANKGAFRVGNYISTGWNNEQIGEFSFSCGNSTIASGRQSFASGSSSIASGDNSAAFGKAGATGAFSFASGYSRAIGSFSTAGGYNSSASGENSTAFGYNATAQGISTVALGDQVHSKDHYSVAIGSFASTALGSFAIGDRSTSSDLSATTVNSYRSRFAGGYWLFSNSAMSVGVVLLPSDNSWGSMSDYRLKENFHPVDGESLLLRMRKLQLVSWNYKTQNPKASRHYGPMAQEFHHAFGKDKIGSIGSDTLINQQDFLGVTFIAIQALATRTVAQKNKIQQLERKKTALVGKTELLESRIDRLERLIKKRIIQKMPK